MTAKEIAALTPAARAAFLAASEPYYSGDDRNDVGEENTAGLGYPLRYDGTPVR